MGNYIGCACQALYIGEKCPYCRCYSISYFSEFQKKVFFQFARLEKKLDRLAKQYEPNISEYHLVQMSTLDEFDEFEVKFEVEWGFYALSASKAIFRAKTYNE